MEHRSLLAEVDVAVDLAEPASDREVRDGMRIRERPERGLKANAANPGEQLTRRLET